MFVILDLTLVFLEPFYVLVPLEEEIGNLLLKPTVLDLLPFRVGINFFILPARAHFKMFCLEHIFLELNEHELIPPCLS